MSSRYATTSDLSTYGIPAAAIASVSGQTQAALDAASAKADSYLVNRYTLPLTQWGTDLTSAVCAIAVFDLMALRGFAPEGADDMIRGRAKDALRWLEQVGSGAATPIGIVDGSGIGRRSKPSIVTGVAGNTVGGTLSPSPVNQLAGPRTNYPYIGVVPGRRGW
jgi:phage gp36-like protein